MVEGRHKAIFRFLSAVLVAASLFISPISAHRSDASQTATPLFPGSQTKPVKFSGAEEFAHRPTSLRPFRLATRGDGDMSQKLRVIVNPDGTVRSATAIAGSSEYREAALREVENWRYKPFEKEGKPVAAEVDVQLDIYPKEVLPTMHVPFPRVDNIKDVQIEMRRWACEGRCPSYEVTISGDGSVAYNGGGYVAINGRRHDRIPARAVQQLIDLFKMVDFYSLSDRYDSGIMDGRIVDISISVGGQKKSVHDNEGLYVGIPQRLLDLEDEVDRIVDTAKWIDGTEAGVDNLRSDKNWSFESRDAGDLLVSASEKGATEFAHTLIKEGAPLDSKSYGLTPLLMAAGSGHADIVKLLIAAGAAKIDREQTTQALIYSGRLGDASIIRALVEAGGDPGGRTRNDENLLLMAVRSGNLEAVRQVLQYNPDVNAEASRSTALSEAASLSSEFHPAADPAGIVRLLIAAGAGVERRNQFGQTPLMHAYDLQVVNALIEAGADVNARDKDGNTVLHHASSATVPILLRQGAAVDSRNADGDTPLLTAWDEDKAIMLIEAGADVSLKGKDGRSFLEKAREGGWTKALALAEKRSSTVKSSDNPVR